MPRRIAPILSLLLAAALVSPLAWAADKEIAIRIKDHRFIPAEVKVPAGEKLKLVVSNEDKTAEEFESKSLKREKVIQGGATATIVVGPLKPGKYPFFGEFNEATAQGVLVAE